MKPDDFSNKIGYTFKNPGLKEQAVTRAGFAKEKRDRHEECPDQLEFTTLGDAVLKVALVQILKEEDITSPGEITIKKSYMENKTRLARIAINMNIWPDIRKDKSEESRGPETQPRLMAETLEALIGTIFLDSDFESVKNVISNWYRD
jgi:ribonuclease-3